MKRSLITTPCAAVATSPAALTSRSRRLAVGLALLAMAGTNRALCATLYWDGTGSSWNTVSGWSADPSLDTPNPSAVPGSGDVATFNTSTATTLQTVTLDANQAASKLSVLEIAAGGVILLGGGTDRTLSLGSGGIEIASGAGPVVIGSSASGQGAALALTGNQTWTNGSAHSLVVNNGITNTAVSLLTLRGAGGFQFNGASTYTNGTVLSTTTLGIGNNAALGAGTLTVNSGTIQIDDWPRTLSNKVLINSTSTSTWTGDGSLTLSGNDSAPAFAITRNAAPTINLVNTAPLVIAGVFSLSDTTLPNNNPQGFSLASSANLVISGEIIECNAGNAASANNRGTKIVFYGTGANVTLSGTNDFGAGSNTGKSMDIAPPINSGNTIGYNTVTVGRPAGSGKTINPFGRSALFTNSGAGFYLKALEDGLTVTNDISLGASSGGDGGRPIGFDGEKELTLGGSFLLGASVSLPNLATGTLTFSGTLNSYSRVLTLLGPGNTAFASNSLITGTTGGIGKQGPGTLTLAGYSDTPGPTTLNGGAVILDYSAGNTNRMTQGTNAITALTLGGVDLQLKGGSYAHVPGTGGGTTIGSGQSRVRRTEGGSGTLALGAITRATTSGGVIDLAPGVASTTTANVNGTLGSSSYGFATVGGSDWATGGGTINALAAYDSFAVPGTDKNILHSGSGSTAGATVNTLKITTTAAGQALSLGGLVTLSRSGLLFTGSDDYTITGGSIRGRTDYQGDMIVHHYGSGVLTLESMIAVGNNMSVVKAGPGTLVLANPTNSYAGPTYLNAGVLSVSSSNNLGSGASGNTLVLNGGTLRVPSGFAMSRAVSLSFNGGTFQVDSGTLVLSGIVSGNYGALNKTGAGTLLLANTNLYSGPTTVSAGTLKLGSGSALGLSATVANRSVSPVTVEATGVLDMAGQTNAVGNFTLKDGRVADSVGGGVLGAYSFAVHTGIVEAVLADVTVPNASNPRNSISLYKRTAGTVTLAATNLYSGHTFVEAGTLRVNGALAASPVLVQATGTLAGTGTVQRTVNVEGGTLAPGASGALPGTLTLGRHLRIDSSGTLQATISPSGYSKVVLSNPQARVLLPGASLSLAVLPGSGATLGASMTLVENQGSNPVEGTFTGLPEGSTFTADGRRFTITYQGGDGNDIVLAAKASSMIIMVR